MRVVTMAENPAEKASNYTADTLQKTKAAAEETAKMMQQSYATASRGTVDFNLKLIEMAQDHMNAAFDFARQLAQVKSPSEFLELSTSHARKQFDRFAAQGQDLSGLAQKGMTETAQTLQTGIDEVSKRT
jgi:phasin